MYNDIGHGSEFQALISSERNLNVVEAGCNYPCFWYRKHNNNNYNIINIQKDCVTLSSRQFYLQRGFNLDLSELNRFDFSKMRVPHHI